MHKTFGIAAALLLTACAHEVQVVVVDPAKRCEPSAALTQGCTGPVALKDGLSYRDMLVDYQTDRERLRSCTAQQADLAKAIAACNDEIDKHNQRLSQSQATAGGK